jgi:flagellin
MALTINTNTSASHSAANLTRSSDLMQKSLMRLSSGSRISSASDDAGGLAVSMKLAASLKRNDVQSANVANALAFLQTAAGSLQSAAAVFERLSELGTLASDVTKASGDIDNYATEYNALVTELSKLTGDTFNGLSLFSSTNGGGSLTVFLSEDGRQSMTITQNNLADIINNISALSLVTGSTVSTAASAIQDLANEIAINGAQTSRLQFALDSLNTGEVNLESARSKIYDVDVASETTKLARANILVQSGASMLAQANAASQVALKLLQ